MNRTSKNFVALLLAAVLTLVAALNAVGAQNVHGSVNAGPTPPPPPFSGTPMVTTPTPVKNGSTFHQLTAKQKKQLLKIMSKDTTLKKLLKGKKYAVTNQVVWATINGDALGGVVTLKLKRAATLKGSFLDLDYDCSGTTKPPYGRVVYKAQYSNVRLLTVYVDLHLKRVAGIRPLGFLVGKAKYPPAYQSRAKATCHS